MAEFSNILHQLTSLLADSDFKAELVAFRRAFQRMKVRLRNNLLTSRLKQLSTLTRKFEAEFPSQLALNYGDGIEKFTGKRKDNAFKSLHRFIRQLISFLDQIIEKTLHLYSYTQPYFKLGHLIHHLIFLRVSVSRLRICFKALLVYACDLMIELSQNSLVEKIEGSDDKLSLEDIHAILKKNDCKPRVKHPIDSHHEDVSIKDRQSSSAPHLILAKEEFGVLIDRDSLKPEIAKSEKSRAKKKARLK